MPRELVIDTNIFVHANNEAIVQHQSALALVSGLLEHDDVICVDPGFSIENAKNRSSIVHEYLTHVHHGSFAFYVLGVLGTNQRINEKPKQTDSATNKVIRQHVHDKTDSTFVKVARYTNTGTLVSHDFRNFPTNVRKTLERLISVFVIAADEI
ncbi:MAG: hypothetical protein KF698_06620 [Anaerolineales bacterium]|nr:hypothetical protein [Anaerolineales bacterium]